MNWLISQFQGLTHKEAVNRIFSNPGKYLTNYNALMSLRALDRYFNLSGNKHFIDAMNSTFIAVIEDAGLCTWHNDNVYDIFSHYKSIFIPDTKEKLFGILLTKNRKLSQSRRKRLMKLMSSDFFIAGKDDRFIRVFKEFYRSLSPDDFNQIMSKIQDGMDNPEVKSVLSKTKIYGYLKYDRDKIESDPNEKVKLLRNLALSHSILKHIDFDLCIGFEHIKELAPVMRFDFLKFAYQHELDIFCRTYYSTHDGRTQLINLIKRAEERKKRYKVDRLKVSAIDPEQIRELLFSVSMQKNEEVNRWFGKYTKYYNILNGKDKVDIWGFKSR